jgi:hypothetical protein
LQEMCTAREERTTHFANFSSFQVGTLRSRAE